MKLEFSTYDPDRDQGEFHESGKFTEAQIAFILKQAEDGVAVAEVCR